MSAASGQICAWLACNGGRLLPNLGRGKRYRNCTVRTDQDLCPMVKVLELADVAPLVSEQDVLGEGGPFVDPVCAEAPAGLVSRLTTYAIAGGMILLAPFLILSLAAAFVVACLRLQGGDGGQEASMVDQPAS